MKKSALFIFIGLFLILSGMLTAQNNKVTVTNEQGDVFSKGNELWTENGKAQVRLPNGNDVRLDNDTKVIFTALKGFKFLDIEHGQVYIQAETTVIMVRTPHKVFPIHGIWLIKVDENETKEVENPIYENDFEKWAYPEEVEVKEDVQTAVEIPTEVEKEPEEEIYQEETREQYPYYGYYPYYSYYPYWSWTNWYYYYYPYYSHYYSHYYYSRPYYSGSNYSGSSSQYGYNSYRDDVITIVRKDQLKRRTPVSQTTIVTRNTTTKNTLTRKPSQTSRTSTSRISSSRTKIRNVAKIPEKYKTPWGDSRNFGKSSPKVSSSRIRSSNKSRSSSRTTSRGSFAKTSSRSSSRSSSTKKIVSKGKVRKK